MTTTDDLLASIFDGLQRTFYAEFEAWVKGSRRFKVFAADYRVKIRAKLKNVHDDAGAQDLRAELEIAARLLTEKRFTLEYEKYAASKQRAPDFTVTFKTHTPFNVEVRRIRGAELEDGDTEAPTGKLLAVVCDKVGQMPRASSICCGWWPNAKFLNPIWRVQRRRCANSPSVKTRASSRGTTSRALPTSSSSTAA